MNTLYVHVSPGVQDALTIAVWIVIAATIVFAWLVVS